MDRDEFMELVYETFADEPDNVLANGIIEAADAYVEHEKAQLSQQGTTKDATSDLISRQAARHALCKAVHKGEDIPCENQTASCLWTGTRVCDFVREIDALPTIQPVATDAISRRAAIDALQKCRKHCIDPFDSYHIDIQDAEYQLSKLPTIQPVATDTNVGDTISKFIDGLEEIFADIRERHVDDSVCGLCEYDGAYMGQSGDWCNECPGFDRDDCFKLSDKTRKKWTDEIIKALPPAHPEPSIPVSWIENEIKWLKSLDNTFSEITALQISAMVNKWRDEKK